MLVSVAAGDMDCGFLMFLSSHIMHHLFIQLNTNTGYRVQLQQHLSTAPFGRNRKKRETDGETSGKKGWFKTKQWADLITGVCVYCFTLKMDILADNLYVSASLHLLSFLHFE